MKTVVLKFGGTSVGSIDRIKKVCKIIAFYKKKKNRVLVVPSAMSGVTNELIKKSGGAKWFCLIVALTIMAIVLFFLIIS